MRRSRWHCTVLKENEMSGNMNIPDSTNRGDDGVEYMEKHYPGLLKRLANAPLPEPENPTVARKLIKTLKLADDLLKDAGTNMHLFTDTITKAESQLANAPKQYSHEDVEALITWSRSIHIPAWEEDAKPNETRDVIIDKLRANVEPKVLEFEIIKHSDTYYSLKSHLKLEGVSLFWRTRDTYEQADKLANAIAKSLGMITKMVEK